MNEDNRRTLDNAARNAARRWARRWDEERRRTMKHPACDHDTRSITTTMREEPDGKSWGCGLCAFGIGMADKHEIDKWLGDVPVMAPWKGGQGHDADDVEASAMALVWTCVGAVVLAGIIVWLWWWQS